MLTKEQKTAHDKIMDWLSTGSPYIALSGYAGTGKTTLLGGLAKSIQNNHSEARIHFITYTGKASSVLGHKLENSGIDWQRATCGTIHSLLYKYLGFNKKKNEMIWENKSAWDITGDLLIIDEASMITQKIFKDLLRLKKKILFVGDPGQLPPINESLFPPLLETDLQLTEIHRQAWDNPIIRLATMVRNGEQIPFGVHDGKAARLKPREKQSRELIDKFSKDMPNDIEKIALCGFNKSRVRNNTMTRIKAGYPKHPVEGERLICLKNNKSANLMNGFIVPLSEFKEMNPNLYRLRIEGYGDFFCPAQSFNNPNPTNRDMATGESIKEDELMYFDYAYYITVHKSQGSEWDKVMLLNERIPNYSEEEYTKWLYTGITRAREKLLIVG